MVRLIELIQQNYQEFLVSLKNNYAKSLHYKSEHWKLIEAVSANKHISANLYGNRTYFTHAIEYVIWNMRVPHSVKREMLAEYYVAELTLRRKS